MATNAKNLAEYLNNETTSASADIADGSITAAKLAAGAVTTAKVADNAVTSAKALNLGRRNLVINGAMQVAQRGTSTTGITGSVNFICDRWGLQVSSLGTHTITQETLTSGNAYNDGFTKAFRVDCTTAKASPTANDHIFFQQKIEAQNLQHLAYGTSGAKALTLSFWVKSNKTGTYEIMHYVSDSGRQVNSTYTISSANTWEKKVLSIPADTGGSGINNDNGEGFRSIFYLAVGSTRQSGSTPSSWSAYAVGNEAPSQTVNIGDSTANDWAITGYQLEVGSSATDFEHRSFQEELDLCHRYFYNGITANGSGNYSAFPINFRNFVSTGNNGHIVFTVALPKPMRTIPTFTHDLANSNHAGSGTGANADNWQFYHQNQGWGSYAGNGNMNTLSRQGSSDAQVQLGTYYISPNANSYDQLTIGSNRKFHFSAEL